MKKPEDFMYLTVAVLPSQVALVYAALAGNTVIQHSGVDIEDLGPVGKVRGGSIASANLGTLRNSDGAKTSAQADPALVGNGLTATTDASPSDVDAGEPVLDAHGHPWSELLHATTKGTTKDGLWRMKPGVTRPAPMPGFPVEEATSTTTAGEETQPAASAPTEAAQTSETSTVDEDDEFAAFRAADAATAAVEEEAVASIPARKWTDADLGKLCNQAAVKLGDPVPVKEIIQQFTPEGEVAHSRNIPEEAREDFAKAVEAKAGIEFAG